MRHLRLLFLFLLSTALVLFAQYAGKGPRENSGAGDSHSRSHVSSVDTHHTLTNGNQQKLAGAGVSIGEPLPSDTAWLNTGNVSSAVNYSNNNTTGPPFQANYTQYLEAYSFGFSIPAGATILGIEVTFDAKCSPATCAELRLSMVKGGTIVSSGGWAFVNNPDLLSTNTNYTRGSSTSLWNTTWTPSDINNANFGFVIQGVAPNNTSLVLNVRNVKIKVYYQT